MRTARAHPSLHPAATTRRQRPRHQRMHRAAHTSQLRDTMRQEDQRDRVERAQDRCCVRWRQAPVDRLAAARWTATAADAPAATQREDATVDHSWRARAEEEGGERENEEKANNARSRGAARRRLADARMPAEAKQSKAKGKDATASITESFELIYICMDRVQVHYLSSCMMHV